MDATLDEDSLLDELILEGATELGAVLENAVLDCSVLDCAVLDSTALDAGFDVVGDPSPPPPPQAVNANATLKQAAPVKGLNGLFILSPSLLSFLIIGLYRCNRLRSPVYR